MTHNNYMHLERVRGLDQIYTVINIQIRVLFLSFTVFWIQY